MTRDELTRRRTLGLLAGASTPALAGCNTTSTAVVTYPTDTGGEGTSSTDTEAEKTECEASKHEAIVETNAPDVPPPTEFVAIDGTEFVLDDEPVTLTGFNNDELTSPYSERARVDEIVEEVAGLGLNSLRTWAFWHGKPAGETDPARVFQLSPGQYGELAFRRLDYIIAKAKRHGVRLILPFVNNWDNIGSMKDYVRWIYPDHDYPEGRNGRGELHDKFYTDENVRELFYEYIRHVVTRENTITGIEYRNDPTILMWELANEPRFTAATKQEFSTWIAETSEYVKSLDSNHLVSAGTEGKYGFDIHDHPTIDAYSFHCWPDHWDMTVEEGTAWIENQTNGAHEILDRPAYLGEFGWPVHRGQNKDENREAAYRERVFTRWGRVLRQVDCNGSMPYALRGHAYNKVPVGERPPLSRYEGEHADPYAMYHPEDESTILSWIRSFRGED